MEFSCRRISAAETIPLRSRVLRAGMELSACVFPLDEESVHFGAFAGAELISIVTAHREDKFGGGAEWRIRGMATNPEYQGQGAGAAVLRVLLAWGKAEGVRRFWCNAREPAIAFYERHGFTVESELFDIPTAGPHKVMKREA